MCEDTPIRQCGKCGLLAMRNRETRQLDETERKVRAGEEPPMSNNASSRYMHETTPICVAGVVDFDEEMGESESDDWSVNMVECCNRERKCGDFIQWVTGLSPKEHIEMGFMADEREKSRAWLERCESESKAFYQRLEDERKKFDKTLANEARSTALNAALIGIVAALVGTVAGAVISAAIAYWIIPSSPNSASVPLLHTIQQEDADPAIPPSSVSVSQELHDEIEK